MAIKDGTGTLLATATMAESNAANGFPFRRSLFVFLLFCWPSFLNFRAELGHWPPRAPRFAKSRNTNPAQFTPPFGFYVRRFIITWIGPFHCHPTAVSSSNFQTIFCEKENAKCVWNRLEFARGGLWVVRYHVVSTHLCVMTSQTHSPNPTHFQFSTIFFFKIF